MAQAVLTRFHSRHLHPLQQPHSLRPLAPLLRSAQGHCEAVTIQPKVRIEMLKELQGLAVSRSKDVGSSKPPTGPRSKPLNTNRFIPRRSKPTLASHQESALSAALTVSATDWLVAPIVNSLMRCSSATALRHCAASSVGPWETGLERILIRSKQRT